MISVYRSSETLGEKRKLRAARGSGITATRGYLYHARMARRMARSIIVMLFSLHNPVTRAARALAGRSPNQVLTHAARAAATQLNKLNSATLWPRAARAKGPGQGKAGRYTEIYWVSKASLMLLV